MTVREDIIAKLMAEPTTKIDGEPTQSDIDTLKNELTKRATKLKTTKDVTKHGKKYGFQIIAKYQTIIKNSRDV